MSKSQAAQPRKYLAVIFDIGDVLFSWSPPTTTSVAPPIVKAMISHPTWFAFEQGEISISDCYAQLMHTFSIPSVRDVSDVFDEARKSLKHEPILMQLLHDIKQTGSKSMDYETNDLKLYVMSNMSKEDFAYLRKLDDVPWKLFDSHFISGHIGMRKPDLRFFEHVLRQIGMTDSAEKVLFIDDKLENIQAAKRAGMHGMQFKSGVETAAAVRGFLAMDAGYP